MKTISAVLVLLSTAAFASAADDLPRALDRQRSVAVVEPRPADAPVREPEVVAPPLSPLQKLQAQQASLEGRARLATSLQIAGYTTFGIASAAFLTEGFFYLLSGIGCIGSTSGGCRSTTGGLQTAMAVTGTGALGMLTMGIVGSALKSVTEKSLSATHVALMMEERRLAALSVQQRTTAVNLPPPTVRLLPQL